MYEKILYNNLNSYICLTNIDKRINLNFMKNVNYIINGVLALAVIVLFVMQFSEKEKSEETKPFAVGEDGSIATLPLAYVNMDSLLLNYNYSKDLNEIIMKKQEDSRVNLNQRANSLRNDVQDFEKKLQNNAFLTRERAEQEQQRLMKKEQDLRVLEERLTQELMNEQQKLTQQLRDTIVSQLGAYNQSKGYQVVFSNTMGDNILLAGDAYDITDELIDFLNKSYTPAPVK